MAITPSGAVTQDLVNGVHKVGYDQDVNPGTLNSGTLIVDGNSIADLTATNLAAQRAQRLDIGNEAGTNGLVTITGGSGATIHFDNDGLDDTATGLIIGNHGGDGRLELTAGGIFEIKDLSTVAVGSDYDDQEYVVIGRDANSRGELSADASTFHVEGNSVFMELGRNDGDGAGAGEATFTNGSKFHLKAAGAGADSEVYLQIGRGTGASGTMSFDHSTGTLDAAADSYASLQIGRQGGSGLLALSHGSHFTMNAGLEGAYANVGYGAGSVGKVTISDHSSLFFQGIFGAGANGLTVGTQGGTGTVELTTGSVLGILGQETAVLHVGRDNGFGVLNAGSGTLIQTSGLQHTYVAIGAYGGIGQMMLDGSVWNINPAATDAAINIGHDGWADGDDSGTGRLTLRGGATINFLALTYASLNVGGGAGSVAQLYVTDGSVIDMESTGILGDSTIAQMLVGYYGASAALVVIDGPDAEIQDLDYVGVGFNDQDPYSLAGHGTLLVTNGAQITSNQAVVVGAGGTVGGFDGTITSTLYLTGGGLIDLRDGQFGNFDINGDTFVDGAGNQILGDIGANDSNPLTQDGDLIKFNGNFSSTADGQFLMTLNALDGFKFGVGETRIIGEHNGGGDATPPTFAVTNQHADFAFYGGTLPGNPGKIVIQALNSGATGGLGIVDFGAGNPAATANYNAVANNGFVSGGRFGVGGSATNADQFLGTNFNDVLRITTPGNGSRAFTLDGRGGADYLLGGAGADTLIGGAGGDLLNGGAGADLLHGGTDNDVYVVDNANDKVDEATLGSGTGDLVQSSVTFSLANTAHVFGSVEKLTLTGGLAISGTGNALSNTIVGNLAANVLSGNAGNDALFGGNGNDTLNGGLGNDTLTGGINNDFFLFNTALNASTNRDVITDYSVAQDTFRLENAIFTKLGAGVHALSSAFFRAGPKALDANDYIVYNKATGLLSYDNDGNGAHAAVAFALLTNRPTLTFSEFQVV